MDAGIRRDLQLDTLKVLDPNGLLNLSLAFAVASSALTITLKDSKGAALSATNPGFASQRHATVGNATFAQRTVAAAVARN